MGKKAAVNDAALIAACGLYCGACFKYLNGKCPGCHKNEQAGWCSIRRCVLEQGVLHCGQCKKADYHNCATYNNRIGRFFAWLFRSNRPGCLERIGQIGEQGYAREMTATKKMTIKR